jgi:hypothetical protein
MRLLEVRQAPEGRQPEARQEPRRRFELRPGRRDRREQAGRHEPQEGRHEPETRQGLPQRQERRSDRHLTRLPRRRLATLLALGVAVGAIGGYSLGSHARSPAVTTEAGGVHATPECTSAVARANTTIAWAVKMGRAFVQQTQVVNQLARGQTTVAAAVRDDQAPSAEGMAAVSRFNDALADYLRVVDSCQLESG